MEENLIFFLIAVTAPLEFMCQKKNKTNQLLKVYDFIHSAAWSSAS